MARPARVAYQIFMILQDIGYARPGDLARALNLPIKNIHSALKTLEKRFLVEKKYVNSGYYYFLKKEVWVA